MASEIDYAEILQQVALSIASLKQAFPQLNEFSPEKNDHPQGLSIEYAYHTHRPQHRVGWTSGVPNPDDDGIWFYLDFHDPDSMAQIHTQPWVGRKMCLGKKIAWLLILEGQKTKPLAREILSILEKYGVKPCGLDQE